MEVMIIVILATLTCALIGNFLVLRKLSLMGDAISHAVLFGIVMAFFIVGTLHSIWFFILSVLFAVFLGFIVQWIVERVSISRESIIGVVFTFFFALGVLLIVQFAGNIHLDTHAVLFGSVEFSVFERFVFLSFDLGPKSMWTLGAVFLLNIFLIKLFYKELKITTFDPNFATSVGISPKLIHYLVMFLTSITVVTAFEAVGAILVVALLVVPVVTSYIFNKRLNFMIGYSLFFALLSSIVGYLFSVYFDVSVAGAVAFISGVILCFVVILYKMFAYEQTN
ncbi:metal ABC transporter permease [Candidatus Peregrinibacteria bacterium CG10_big_fil_rev_8_21_14_0_10_36_19]|nr:MAG: metal ABC transporter permease [Candidatus Peregrinibacteria bacterium CG10_big_fil_rev_8_21_14_0_10_36_19]